MKQKPTPEKTEYSLEITNRDCSHYRELFTEGDELGPFHSAQRVLGVLLKACLKRPLIDDEQIIVLLRKRR